MVGERLIDVVDVDERRLSEGLEECAGDGIMRALIGRTVDERVRQVSVEALTLRLKVRLEGGDTFVIVHDSGDIFRAEAAVGAVSGEEFAAELRELLPAVGEALEFVLGNLAGHQGVEVVRRFFLRGGDVARDVEVVAFGDDLFFRDEPCEVRDIAPRDDGVVDALHIRLLQDVLRLVFLEGLGGVDEEDVASCAVLREDHDDDGDAGREEEVRRQADDRLDVVVLDEVFADLFLGAAAEEDAVWQDDGHDAVLLDVVEAVEQEGEVSLGRRGQAVLAEALVARVELGVPVCGVGRVGRHSIDVERAAVIFWIDWPVFVECVGVADDEIIDLYFLHEEVHLGEV